MDYWKCGSLRVVYSGPVRAGKTRAVLEKHFYFCVKYPGVRCLWLRLTKDSMAQTVLQTFEEYVMVPDLLLNPPDEQMGRTFRQSYRFKNGSEIVVGGLDNVDKYLSGEYDFIAIFQAEEAAKHDLDILMTRLSNFKAPYQQISLDCNPQGPEHWIKKLCEATAHHNRPVMRVPMIQGSLKDNPKYFDRTRNQWTKEGQNFVDSLGILEGHEYQRKVLGKWVSPEGARFKCASRHVQGFKIKDRFPGGIPKHFKRWMSIDYGVSSPYAAYWHTLDEEGRIFTYREDYQIGYEAREQAKRWKILTLEGERISEIRCDRSIWGRLVGLDHEQNEVYKQYADEIRDDRRFGPLKPGIKNTQEIGYVTLENLLKEGKWFIEESCTALWGELEGAVYYEDKKTGIRYELINPNPQKKACPDHALEACVYGLCRNNQKTSGQDDEVIDFQEVRSVQHSERVNEMRSEMMRWGSENRENVFKESY
jgi:PBSX family phage terminase large subunit